MKKNKNNLSKLANKLTNLYPAEHNNPEIKNISVNKYYIMSEIKALNQKNSLLENIDVWLSPMFAKSFSFAFIIMFVFIGGYVYQSYYINQLQLEICVNLPELIFNSSDVSLGG